MKNNKKVKFLKLQFSAALVLLVVVIASGVFIFTPISWQQVAQALSGNYSKSSGEQLNNIDWNNLLVDFLSKDGGSQVDRGDGTMIDNFMHGDLDMGSHHITNLADPNNDNDAATKGYVDASITGGGGTIFVNWGRGDCPAGTQELYNGFAFGSKWDEEYGGTNVVCIQYGDAGPPNLNPTDNLWPFTTGQSSYMPPGIAAERMVRCAVCYKNNGICYEQWGSDSCNPGLGFTPIYSGYMVGGVVGTAYAAANKNQSERHCLNINFDSSIPREGWGAIWYGSSIYNNSGVEAYFPSDINFIKCAVCCN